MSKCPFWSNKKESVRCYRECPMQIDSKNEENCPFQEMSIEDKVAYKDFIDDELAYSTDNFLAYSFNEKITENY